MGREIKKSIEKPTEDVEYVESLPEPATLKKPIFQEIRERPKLVTYCLGLSVSFLLLGFDYSVVSTISAMPQFQQVFGEYHDFKLIIPAAWLGLWNGMYPIGAMIGSICSGLVQDRFGRRLSLFIGSILTAASVAVCYISDVPVSLDGKRGLFLFGKLLQGFAMGHVVSTSQTYISENLPPGLRGLLFALNPLFQLLGQLLGAVVVQALLTTNGPQAYRTCFATQWPFSVIPLLLSVFMPESPPWLIRQLKVKDARQSFHRVGSAGVGNLEQEFQSLVQLVIEEHQRAELESDVRYIQCFQGENLRRTLIAVFASLIPTAFGLPLLASVSYFFPILGMTVSTSLTLLIIGVVLGIVANIVSFWTLVRFGRRSLMIYSLAASSIVWLASGVAGIFSGGIPIWFIAGSMMAIIVIVGVGAWPASVVISVEVSSLQLRAKTLGIYGLVSNLISGSVAIVLPYVYNPDSGNFGGKTSFIFAALCGISFVVTIFAVPEMKGRSAEEIDIMFEARLATRKFKSWATSGSKAKY
ncbi:hypothetical protein TWF192_007049 [Orbilia oligospora]|uniref:Uncharacterized protein n=1 Tax=Orbilia oligospora TaxID=2813651 RepID=A0A6G1ML36_ORBOL|nr:hypothetical protein TWF191_000227 [Orbilia oligospora]KAF3262375.1 hypothetical protein TWF192_007049 [Orbilia oligospora]